MNKAILTGRLVRDPDLRYTPGNVPVCQFTLAVQRKHPQEGGPDADFLPVVAWGKLGENCNKYLDKGRMVAVVGRIQNKSFETSTGEKRTVTEIIADEVEFLGGNNNSQE